jgi:hypothetical protein
MANQSKKLTVTAVAHQSSGSITAFFNELPALVVQGDSEDDIDVKLRSLLGSYIKMLESRKDNIVISTKSFS